MGGLEPIDPDYEGPQQVTLRVRNRPGWENPKMTTDLQAKEYENEAVVYLAMELSNEKWRLAFGDGTRARARQVCIGAGDIAGPREQVDKAKAKVRLGARPRCGELL
jgi:hypothetical protein